MKIKFNSKYKEKIISNALHKTYENIHDLTNLIWWEIFAHIRQRVKVLTDDFVKIQLMGKLLIKYKRRKSKNAKIS